MREIALDTETTGLDPATGDRIVEIGCVEMIGRIRTGKVFHTYVNPERDVPQEAFKVHGLSSEFLADKPLFSQVAQPLLDFLGDAPFVIHNAQFDMRFLNAEFERHGHPPFPATRATDTLMIARQKFPGSPASLDALCKRFNIDLSARTHHGALLDAELLAEMYLELMGGRQSTLLLDAEAHSSVSQGIEVAETVKIPARQFPVSQEESQLHESFVRKMKNPLWVAFLHKEETENAG